MPLTSALESTLAQSSKLPSRNTFHRMFDLQLFEQVFSHEGDATERERSLSLVHRHKLTPP